MSVANQPERPVTARDLRESINDMKQFILDREIAMIWKFLLLGLSLLAAQWAAITWMMAHWKP